MVATTLSRLGLSLVVLPTIVSLLTTQSPLSSSPLTLLIRQKPPLSMFYGLLEEVELRLPLLRPLPLFLLQSGPTTSISLLALKTRRSLLSTQSRFTGNVWPLSSSHLTFFLFVSLCFHLFPKFCVYSGFPFCRTPFFFCGLE